MLGRHNETVSHIELDRDMLETMLSMFDTHASEGGILRVYIGDRLLTVKNPRTRKNDLLGVHNLPNFLRK